MALGLEASGLEYFTWRDNIKSSLGIQDASYVHGSLTFVILRICKYLDQNLVEHCTHNKHFEMPNLCVMVLLFEDYWENIAGIYPQNRLVHRVK